MAEGETIGSHKSARLKFRPPRETDLAFTASLFALPELVVHRPDPKPDTFEDSRQRLQRDMAHWKARGFGRWLVSHGSEPIGFGGVTWSEQFNALSISYHLLPEVWGKGFASEIVAEALSLAFGPLAADTVIGLVRPTNPASCRVLQKAGFLYQRDVMLHGAPTRLFVLKRPRHEAEACR